MSGYAIEICRGESSSTCLEMIIATLNVVLDSHISKLKLGMKVLNRWNTSIQCDATFGMYLHGHIANCVISMMIKVIMHRHRLTTYFWLIQLYEMQSKRLERFPSWREGPARVFRGRSEFNDTRSPITERASLHYTDGACMFALTLAINSSLVADDPAIRFL